MDQYREEDGDDSNDDGGSRTPIIIARQQLEVNAMLLIIWYALAHVFH